MNIIGRLKSLEGKLKQQANKFKKGSGRKGGKLKLNKKSDFFHRVIEFQTWMECWDLFREISVSLEDFILKSSTSIADVSICCPVSIAGN